MVTDYRLWLLAQIIQRRGAIQDLIRVACDRAASESDALMPGFTHLQPAQTVRWGHWMMCHATSWQRDDQRLRDMIPRISQLPLGSGALAGNPFLVDRQFLAQVCAIPYSRQGSRRGKPQRGQSAKDLETSIVSSSVARVCAVDVAPGCLQRPTSHTSSAGPPQLAWHKLHHTLTAH